MTLLRRDCPECQALFARWEAKGVDIPSVMERAKRLFDQGECDRNHLPPEVA